MKRTPEFVLGLIGSIMATVTNALFVVVVGFLSVTSEASQVWGVFWIGLLLSIVAIVMSCLVNRMAKICGVFLIILAIMIEIFNLWNIIPFILLLIAGIMCLARKVEA